MANLGQPRATECSRRVGCGRRKRTKEAIAAAKVRGVKLGGPWNLKNAAAGAAEAWRARAAFRAANLLPVVDAIQAEGITSATRIAKALNERGILTRRDVPWQSVQYRRNSAETSG